MKRTAAYRITSDICFYYAILSIFPPLLPLLRPMALFTAASLAVSLAALYVPWAPLRFVLSLLPGLAFLPVRPGFALVFPALGWLYLILMLTTGRFNVWLEDYRQSCRIMLAICLFSMVSNLLLNLIKPGFTLILPGMCYAMAFFCLNVSNLRRLQMNAEMNLRWNLINGAAVAGVPLLAAGSSLLLWLVLLALKPVAVALTPLAKSITVWLINMIFPINTDVPEPTPTPRPTLTPEEATVTEPGWVTPTPEIDLDWKMDPAVFEKARRIGIFALLVLLVIVLLILILYRVRRSRAKAEKEEFFFEETEEGRPFRRRKKTGSVSDPSNARQIRNIYRKYMQAMRKQGVQIRKDTTSRELLDETEQIILSPAAQRLRELYLAARYDDGDAVTFKDVQEADLCLRQILAGNPRNN